MPSMWFVGIDALAVKPPVGPTIAMLLSNTHDRLEPIVPNAIAALPTTSALPAAGSPTQPVRVTDAPLPVIPMYVNGVRENSAVRGTLRLAGANAFRTFINGNVDWLAVTDVVVSAKADG